MIPLFGALPKYINMAFVLVQHLEPHHKSILAEILSRGTSLTIQQAKNDTKVKPGNVYVIPPNSYLRISHKTLKITPRTRHPDGKYLPIDFFMASLAEDQGKKAAGIILSGTGQDGMFGIKAIKAKGGVTFAQDSKTAKYSSMPEAAAANGNIDFILEPAAIALKLIGLAARSHAAPVKTEKPRINKEESLDSILRLLRDISGVDFCHYKRATVERRIIRRMGFLQILSHCDYYNYLKRNPGEAQSLYKDILIPVTMFFRDPGIFKVLRKKLMPRIIKNRSLKDPIRIWVPACSSGEEVYSIAMAVYEFLEEHRLKPDFQIFGTDLSDSNIEKARQASYAQGISEHVSAVRLRRFFTRTEAGYKIAKHIRDRCIFAKQDITNDPPLSNMDIISCRNLLIYLDAFLQNKVLSVLYYALKPECYLILGTAESIASLSGFFTVIDKKYKIYSKDAAEHRPLPAGSILSLRSKPSAGEVSKMVKKASVRSKCAIPKARAAKPAGYSEGKAASGKRASVSLEKELLKTQNRLRAVIEEKDTVNEELKAANEEIQSSNEELQSTNEELETSKEELQSTNEELLTVNDELQIKNAQLTQLNSDLTNVLTSVNIPLIIVRNDLCIMRFTPMARKVMNLIPTDVGRPIGDIKLNIDIPGLEKTILDVIENMIPAELEVKDGSGKWYSVRVRPYKTMERKIDGAVISMIDIDSVKRAQMDIKDSLDYASSIIETINEPRLVLDHNLRVISANKSFYRMFSVSAPDVENKNIYDICGNKWDVAELRKALKEVLPKKTYFQDLEVAIDFGRTGKKTLSLNARQIYLLGKEKQMILMAAEDITERKESEEVLKRDKATLNGLVRGQAHDLLAAQAELEAAKRLSDIGVLSATVAHELRNPLAAIGMAVRNIRRKANNPDVDVHLANIEKKVLESDRIINNLLFYSRIKPPQYESVGIWDIIKESSEAFQEGRDKDVSVVMDLDHLKGVTVEGDLIQIKEVFSNILNNAGDAIIAPDGRIQISAVCEDDSIKITFTDNGSGIDKAHLAKVFDPFFTTKAKGTGLGLSVCQQIITLHGGSIDIQSEQGKWTSVAVSLPWKHAKEE